MSDQSSCFTAVAWRTALLLKRMKSFHASAPKPETPASAGTRELVEVGGEVLEILAHQASTLHASPPNTATSAKRHAGDAWPTRITCAGSPLPQKGVPMTSNVDSSPTPASERQKVAEMPR